MLIRYDNVNNIRSYQKKVSTAFSKGAIVALDTNGFLIPATATTAVADLVGVIQKDIQSTDTDYAVASYVEVDVPIRKYDWFKANAVTGTPAQTMVGEYHDLTDSLTVDLTASAIGIVKVEKILSATAVAVTFV